MYKTVLIQAGLKEDEAAVYEALLMKGSQTAGSLLGLVKPIKRGTLYQVLRRLEERGLVREAGGEGKTRFIPETPGKLRALLSSREEEFVRSKESLDKALPELEAKFRLNEQRPSIRYFEGIEGLRQIYEEHIDSPAKELFFVRTAKARVTRDHLGKWWAHYKRRRKEKGMVAHTLAPDDPEANHDPAQDKAFAIVRTWIRPEDYTAPIEIDVYGDTVAVISFGKEIFGIAITNAHIAKAFLEVFRLAERGAGTITVKHDHPTKPSVL